MTKIEDKIYVMGLKAFDELLLNRNTSKHIEISIEDTGILGNLIVHIGPHVSFPFSEEEITEFYRKMM